MENNKVFKKGGLKNPPFFILFGIIIEIYGWSTMKKLILFLIIFSNYFFLIADDLNDIIELENVEEQKKVYEEQIEDKNESEETNNKKEEKIDTAEAGNVDKIIKLALKMVGKPYKYGGITPDEGFDCSGLVYYVFKKNGINMNRTVEEQFKQGKEIELFEIRKCDLIFFQVYENSLYNLGIIKNFFTEFIKLYPNHVAIYLGEGKFIHSSKKGDYVKIDTLRKKFWKKHLIGIKRVL